MNKSQKVAVFALVMSMILLTFVITVPFAWGSKRMFPLYFFVFAWIVFGISIIFLRKKQRQAEVESDERDITIKQKAIFASYITLWILTIIGSVIPAMLYEQQLLDSLQLLVFMLPVAVFMMLIIVLLVYSLAVLIQYGWKEKNNE